MLKITWLSILLPTLAGAALAQPLQESEGDGKEQAQDPQDTEEQKPAPTPARPTTEDPLEAARALAKSWPEAVYTIHKGKAQTGVYLQKNTMSKVGEDHVIEFIDYIAMPRIQSEMTIQAHCSADPWFTLRGVAGKVGFGQMKMTFEDGRAQGTMLGQEAVDAEVPKNFLTEFVLLRGLPRMPREADLEWEFDFVDLQLLPGKAAKKGVMQCVGEEELEIEGMKFPSWKFRWTLEDGPPLLLWYGPEGQLLRRVQKREEWLFSPSRTKTQDVSPPSTKDAPPQKKKKRGKGQGQDGN